MCTLNMWHGEARVLNFCLPIREGQGVMFDPPKPPWPPAQMNALMGTWLLREAQKTLFQLINFFQLKFSGMFPLSFPVCFLEANEMVSLLAQSPNFHLLLLHKSLLNKMASKPCLGIARGEKLAAFNEQAHVRRAIKGPWNHLGGQWQSVVT